MKLRVVLGIVSLAAAVPSAVAAADGASLYDKNCAKCHGEDGKADTKMGQKLEAPALAGKTWSVEDVTAAIRGENKRHKSVSKKLGDEDLAAIVEHLATFGGGG